MKFSFLSFSCPELTLDEMFGVAKEFGYDGVEPRIDASHKYGIEIRVPGPQALDKTPDAVEKDPVLGAFYHSHLRAKNPNTWYPATRYNFVLVPAEQYGGYEVM